MSFKVGDKVTWTSQSAGSTRTKIGDVVEIVHDDELPTTKKKDIGMQRKHESYVVRAYAVNRSTKSTKLYWPRVSKLRAYTAEE